MLRTADHQGVDRAGVGAPPRPVPAIVAGRLATFSRGRLASAGPRLLLAAGGLLLLLLPLIVAGALRWDGVYPGVRAGETRLGGADRRAAAARIEADAERWEALPVTLTLPDGEATFTRAELGLRYDREATLAAAFAAGRGGGPLGRLGAMVGLAWSEQDVAGHAVVDEEVLREHLGALAGTADLPARDGDLRIEAGQVVVVPPVAGRGLDVEATAARLLAAVAAEAPATGAAVVVDDLQPHVADAALAVAQARA